MTWHCNSTMFIEQGGPTKCPSYKCDTSRLSTTILRVRCLISARVSWTAIPRFFDDNLQPRRRSDDGTSKVLVTSTLSKYAGKILMQIQRRFPTHPDFVSLKPSYRSTPMVDLHVSKFWEGMWSLSHSAWKWVYIWWNKKVCALYSDNEFVGYGDAINDYISRINLMSINCKLMNEATTCGNNK
jgi:hypothetical protein